MTQPTPAEQLLNLADRAERGPLTRDEAARLRESISQLYGLFERYRDRSNEYADRYLKQRERAERAEAAIERVRAVVNGLCNEDHPSHDHVCPDDVRRAILAALDEHQEQQPSPAVHIGNRANAEDCPACAGTNPDYPFICPGPTKEN